MWSAAYMYINKVIIAGNITRDPELKSLPSGTKVTNLSIATNRVWKDAAGRRQEAADYHSIVVFGRQAEIMAQYLKKGSQAIVEGRLQTRSWDGQDGKKQYKTEVIAERVQFGSSKPQTAANQQPGGVYRKEGAAGSQGGAPDEMDGGGLEEIDYPADDLNPEDIPF